MFSNGVHEGSLAATGEDQRYRIALACSGVI
jgi:hypothetical protein